MSVMTMSDCSTNAMKPKEWAHKDLGLYYEETEGHEKLKMSNKSSNETPKTCSNCVKGTRYVQCCDDAALYGEDCSCDKHLPRADTIEQRYQQLEQVAENLFHSFCFYCKHDEIIKSYRTLLEDLGVSLDD